MELDPPIDQCHTSDKTCFGYSSVKDRWPVVLTQALDDVSRAVSDCSDETKRREGKSIVEQLSKFKYEMQHDRKLEPLEDDGKPDIKLYNDELASLKSPSWYNAPWLFTECYLYRRVATLFARSTHWRSYDVFAKQKRGTFKSSRPAVLELAAKYSELITQIEKGKGKDKGKATAEEDEQDVEQAEWLIFREMAEICLWGNATDLSLLTTLSYEDLQKLQGAAARKAAEDKILSNDLRQAFDVLRKLQKDKRRDVRVDIVLDNAGFELFVDLVLAGYLLAAGLASRVVLHPKDIPWFVSDVMPKDFSDLLNCMAEPQAFYTTPSEDEKKKHNNNNNNGADSDTPLTEAEVSNVGFLFRHWSTLHAEGKMIIRPNAFWTHPGSFWRLPSVAPKLWQDLQESQLVIFKGDLNYRKLTGDGAWDPATPFVKAIGPLGPGSGVRVLALRTCKADVVVGLEKGKDEELRAQEGGGGDSGSRKWAWSGKWAVVQYSDGKS